MTYVEWLRLRRALTVFAIIVGAALVLTLIVTLFGSGHVVVSDHGTKTSVHTSVRAAVAQEYGAQHKSVPLSILLIIAGYAATVMASIFGGYLARERLHTPVSWTKPASRTRIALEYLATDAVGIACVFAIFLAATFVVLWAVGIGAFVRADQDTLAAIAVGAGMAFAYYAIVRAVSILVPSAAGAVVGGSWGVFFALLILSAVPFQRIVHDVIIALNMLNPLAYLDSVSQHGEHSILPFSPPLRIALLWLVGIVAAFAGTVAYRRAEA